MENNHTSVSKQVVVFGIDSQGNVTQQLTDNAQETTLENTLLQALYPDIKTAIAKVPLGFLDGFEESVVANALAKITCNGVEYHLAGGSNASKEGEFRLADHASALAERFQFWPEAAIVYFGILASPCRVMIDEADLTVLVVEDHQLGTNDCRGWIRRSLFNKLELPDYRLYQFRVAFEDIQAKGCFKVMEDAVEGCGQVEKSLIFC